MKNSKLYRNIDFQIISIHFIIDKDNLGFIADKNENEEAPDRHQMQTLPN